jgi:hypothetical protein
MKMKATVEIDIEVDVELFQNLKCTGEEFLRGFEKEMIEFITDEIKDDDVTIAVTCSAEFVD